MQRKGGYTGGVPFYHLLPAYRVFHGVQVLRNDYHCLQIFEKHKGFYDKRGCVNEWLRRFALQD